MLRCWMTNPRINGEKRILAAISLLRCVRCNKLLAKPNAKGKIAAQIKCPRCGSVNEI